MEGFTQVKTTRRQARKEAEASRAITWNSSIPGALWSDVPLTHCHLPGIPYSYYDDEIVMIRQRTAELIERQRAEIRARARAERRNHFVSDDGQWYTLEEGQVHRASAAVSSQWQGIDE